jgi:hypothetical protein
MRSNSLLSRSYSRPGPMARADTLDSVDEDAAGETAPLSAGELDPDLVPPSQPGSANRPSFDFDPAYMNGNAEAKKGTTTNRTIEIEGAAWVLERDEARREVRGDRLSDYACTGR